MFLAKRCLLPKELPIRLLIQHSILLLLLLVAPLDRQFYAQSNQNPTPRDFIELPYQNATLKLNIHETGNVKSNTKILLLSGPTDHWHGDSGWFALLQPMLAQYHVIAVDRPGIAGSDPIEPLGFGSLTGFMDEVITKAFPKLNHPEHSSPKQELIIVAYASGNLSLWPWLAKKSLPKNLQGILLIDPDVLQPHSINQYKTDALPFKENKAAYLAYAESGKYQKRTDEIIAKERSQITALISQTDKMDWDYYHHIEIWRKSITAQRHKFLEVAHYGDYLDKAFEAGDPTGVPLTVIDTDFESQYIAANPDKEGLKVWQAEGSRWYQQLAEQSDGHYLGLQNADHLLMMQQPERIIAIIQNMLSQPQD